MDQGDNNKTVKDREKGAMSIEIAPSPSTLEETMDLPSDAPVKKKSASQGDDYSLETSPPMNKVRCVDDSEDKDIFYLEMDAPSTSKTIKRHSDSADLEYSVKNFAQKSSRYKPRLLDSTNHPRTKVNTYQLEYLRREVLPKLQPNKYRMIVGNNSSLEEIQILLKAKFYETARQCIATVDNFFSFAYINQEPSNYQTSENLKAIRYLEELFHQQIIDMNWTVENFNNKRMINESPYYPISVLQRPGRLTNQLKYLRDKVINYLRNHKYSFFLQRKKTGSGLLAGDVKEGQMITLDFIEDRLKKNEYYGASECIADIDTLFMDCYVHKTVDKESLQTIALFQIGFHNEIAKMMVKQQEIENDYSVDFYPIYGTSEEQNTYQLQLIKNTVATELSKHEYADPFKNSEELRQYLSILYGEDVVEEPISLSTIKKRLERNEYQTALECIQDYDVMFDKVLQTGLEEQLLYIQAEGLKKIFDEKIKTIQTAEGL